MGVINAAKNIGMKKPIIVRLKGTNVEEAKKLIEVRVYVCMCMHVGVGVYLFICVWMYVCCC